jgi:hypothetical protein
MAYLASSVAALSNDRPTSFFGYNPFLRAGVVFRT